MTFFIGSDHAGWELKEQLKDALASEGHALIDVSEPVFTPDDDYPIIASRLAEHMAQSPETKGLLLCGSGQGILIAVNRFPHMRVAFAGSAEHVRLAKSDEDVNGLALPAHTLTLAHALEMIHLWLDTPFRNTARDQRRMAQLSHLPGL